MMQLKDWFYGIVGVIILSLGLLPTLSKMGIGPAWFELNFLPVQLFTWILAAGGAYLLIGSIREITNSNIVGWWSFIVATIVLLIGLFPLLNSFGMGPEWFAFSWISVTVYHILFMIEGLFLMIATVAVEL